MQKKVTKHLSLKVSALELPIPSENFMRCSEEIWQCCICVFIFELLFVFVFIYVLVFVFVYEFRVQSEDLSPGWMGAGRVAFAYACLYKNFFVFAVQRVNSFPG